MRPAIVVPVPTGQTIVSNEVVSSFNSDLAPSIPNQFAPPSGIMKGAQCSSDNAAKKEGSSFCR